jgi:Zn-dependent peptidase ImmA (M78 family)
MNLTTNTDYLIKRVLDECGYLYPYPIDLEELCNYLGIRIVYYKGDTASYRCTNGEHRMYLPKKSEDYYALKHQMGHEIGHFLKHDGIELELPPDLHDFGQYLENQADNFANRLLVPTHLLNKMDFPDDMGQATQMVSEIFDVSRDLAQIRLTQYLRQVFTHRSDNELQNISTKRFLLSYLGYYWRHDPDDQNIVYVYCTGKGFIKRVYVEGCYS